jgi:DNA-binding beta-propeller fold protein YncE
VQTLAGDGTAGDSDGPGNMAEFFGQEGIAVTPDGVTVYVADGTGGDTGPYHRVRAVSMAGISH